MAQIVTDRPKGTCPGCGVYARLGVVVAAAPHLFYVCLPICYNSYFRAKFGPLEEPGNSDLVDALRSAVEAENAASNHLKVKTDFCAYPHTRGEPFE